MQLHDELENAFLLHQEALLELRFELAGDLLGAYVRLLSTHMRHEERLILPIFERAGPVPRWPPVLYTGQHEKMLRLLEDAGNRLLELGKRDRDRRRGAIALLTVEATYVHLVEHHDGAEREGLYPVVDRTASASEHAQVIEIVNSEWRSAKEREATLFDRARRELGAR